MTRAALMRSIVRLVDTLIDDFDIVDLLTTLTNGCVEVLDLAAAAVMLVSPEGDLRLMSSAPESMGFVELLELQAHEGPCTSCFRTGQHVTISDLAHVESRWPHFAAAAVGAGFRGADAMPMRLRGEVIGTLNLFRRVPAPLSDDDIVTAKALADVATIAILQHRAALEARTVNGQLTHALTSRILVEQAKGMIAERQQLTMEQAIFRLRSYARNNNLRLVDIAADIVNRTPTVASLDRRT